MFSNAIGFDAHILQSFPPLAAGSTLVIAKAGGHLDPDYIVSLWTAWDVTGMLVTVPVLVSRGLAKVKSGL